MEILVIKLYFVHYYKICYQHLLWQNTNARYICFYLYSIQFTVQKYFIWERKKQNIELIDRIEMEEIAVFFHFFFLNIILFPSPWFSRQRVYTAVSWKRQIFQEASEKYGLHHLWKWRFSSGASDALHASQNWVPFCRLQIALLLDLRFTMMWDQAYIFC